MKIYRGPASMPFNYDTHQFVSRITPDQLEKGIRSKSPIRFNITKKDRFSRHSDCIAVFEEEDLLPMTVSLLDRLQARQNAIIEIKKICGDREMNESTKIQAIQAALDNLWMISESSQKSPPSKDLTPNIFF